MYNVQEIVMMIQGYYFRDQYQRYFSMNLLPSKSFCMLVGIPQN